MICTWNALGEDHDVGMSFGSHGISHIAERTLGLILAWAWSEGVDTAEDACGGHFLFKNTNIHLY